MVEINYIPCLILPVREELIKDLPDDTYEQIGEGAFVFKEGVRIIMRTKPQSQDEIMENWAKLQQIKEGNNEK